MIYLQVHMFYFWVGLSQYIIEKILCQIDQNFGINVTQLCELNINIYQVYISEIEHYNEIWSILSKSHLLKVCMCTFFITHLEEVCVARLDKTGLSQLFKSLDVYITIFWPNVSMNHKKCSVEEGESFNANMDLYEGQWKVVF